MSDSTQRPSFLRRALLGAAWVLAWLVALGCALWAFGALHFDFPLARSIVGWAFVLALLAAVILLRGPWRKIGAVFGAFVLVLAWWLTQRPSNDRPWQPDYAQTPWAEIDGDRITLHNVRNCDYRTETDFTPQWETRTVSLSHLTGVDLAIDYWGSPMIAHPIVSFQFDDALPVAFSIETRREVGETYSAIGGLYRQYELIYICADERDVIRVRTNYRQGEEIFLYRTTLSAEKARERFQEYLAAMNALHDHPRWYNAITTNCTTTIRTQRTAAGRPAWDWRLLVNGYADEMLYERGAFAGGLPFPELRKRARINDAARAANDSPDFSRKIREGRPGF